MNEFSWYTDSKPHISTYINGAPKKRYLVVDGIAVIGRAVMHYKPNRKGGHTHNHIYNVCNRILFRSKSRRKIGIENKREYRETFELQAFGRMKPFCGVQFLDILKKGKSARITKKRSTSDETYERICKQLP